MLVTTKIYNRPSIEFIWHTTNSPSMSDEIVTDFLTVETEFAGKKTRKVTSDLLTLTVEVTWTSEEDYADYWSRAEVIAYFDIIDAYYASIGGSVSSRTTT